MSFSQKLNRLVTIEQQSTTQDEIGQPVNTWATVAQVWANIRHVSGLQAIKAGADVSIVKASIRIRHMDGMNAGMRVVAGADKYDIQAVLPEGKSRYIDLVCEVVK